MSDHLFSLFLLMVEDPTPFTWRASRAGSCPGAHGGWIEPILNTNVSRASLFSFFYKFRSEASAEVGGQEEAQHLMVEIR